MLIEKSLNNSNFSIYQKWTNK